MKFCHGIILFIFLSSCNPYGTESSVKSLFGIQAIKIPFQVTIEQNSSQSDPAFSLPITFDVTFENAPNHFISSQISFIGTANIGSFSLTGQDKNYSIKVWGLLPPSVSGTIIPKIAASTVFDSEQNPNLASTGTDTSVEIMGPVLDISCGYDHSCALLSSGSVNCFGDNFHGQSSVPLIYQNIGSASAVSAGGHSLNSHTCIAAATGGATCFGEITTTGALLPTDLIKELDSGSQHICGVLDDNSPICWGDNTFNQISIPGSLQGVNGTKQISAAALHTCGVSFDGILNCWGAGGGDARTSPIPSIPYSFTSFGDSSMGVAGNWHSCGLTNGGNIFCWGTSNTSGQLTVEPSLVGTGLAVKMATRYNHTCAITMSGEVKCWGDNTSSQSAAPLLDAVDVCTGNSHSCAVTSSGTLNCWGSNALGQLNIPAGL